MFLETRNDQHPSGLAGLQGRRLVYLSELKPNKYWDEDHVKSFVSGDMQSARFMNKDFFDYVPQAKLLFDTNHKPNIRQVDEGWKRRIVMLPFNYYVENADPDLFEKLKLEAPMILAWMLEGLKRWLANGKNLILPKAVEEETKEYFGEQDLILRFLGSRHCTLGPDRKCVVSELYHRVRAYAGEVGEHTAHLSDKRLHGMFEPHLQEHGLKWWRDNKNNLLLGIELTDVPMGMLRGSRQSG
jgi:putative DNA primase/helicase